MTAYAASSLFQSCDEEDAVPGMLAVYGSGSGFIGTNEYEPIGADNAHVATGLPAACLVSDPAIVLGKPTDAPDTPPAWDAYPAWQVKVNGKAAASLPLRADGLIAVPVSQGPADIAVDWTATPDTILARWLGGLSALVLLTLCFVRRRRLS
jgi:hypothetical protein